MKKLFVLIAVVLFVSCNNDDKESSVNNLKGSWIFIGASGGITGSTFPITTDQQTVLEFSDTTLKTYINSNLVSTHTYTIQTKKSIFGGIRKMIVTPTGAVANDIARVQSYEIKGEKLYLRDECFDCYTAEYEKINPAAF